MDLDPLAAGANDWLYKLAIGVLVTTIDELAERLDAIGAIVVGTREIERAERIVQRADDKQTGESTVELLEHVVQTCRFEGGQILAGTPPQLDPAGTQFVGAGLGRRGADQDHLLGAGGRDFAK